SGGELEHVVAEPTIHAALKHRARKDDHPVVARTAGKRMIRKNTANHDPSVIDQGHAVAGVRVDPEIAPRDCAVISHCRGGAATVADPGRARGDPPRMVNGGRASQRDVNADPPAVDGETGGTQVVGCVDYAIVCDHAALVHQDAGSLEVS